MRGLIYWLARSALSFWRGVREWCGDAAYERYIECARRSGRAEPISESEFYLEQLDKRYSRPNRCC